VDRCLALDTANLRPHVAGPALVLGDKVNTLHYYPVQVVISAQTHMIAIDLVARDHAVNRAPYLFPFTSGSGSISTGDDFYQIALLNPFHSALPTIRSQYFGCQRYDLHESSFAQFPSYRSKNPSPFGILLLIQNHGRIIVESDVGSVSAVHFPGCTHDDRSHYITLFHRTSWRSPFDRSHDHITDTAITSRRTTQDADAQNLFATRIVRYF
jgi:hypothetical protein